MVMRDWKLKIVRWRRRGSNVVAEEKGVVEVFEGVFRRLSWVGHCSRRIVRATEVGEE